VRGPEQLGFVFHQAIDGLVAGLAHQFRGLFAGALAGDAGFDAKQWVGLVFTLVEGGFADSEFGFFGGHGLVSLQCWLVGRIGICSCANAISSILRRASSSCTEAMINKEEGDLGCIIIACWATASVQASRVSLGNALQERGEI